MIARAANARFTLAAPLIPPGVRMVSRHPNPLLGVWSLHRIRFVVVEEFLFSRVPKLLVLILRHTRCFPKPIRASGDLLFGRLCHLGAPDRRPLARDEVGEAIELIGNADPGG